MCTRFGCSNARLDNLLTLSVFESSNGTLVNSVKNPLFFDLHGPLSTSENFLCVPCHKTVVFVKLKRKRASVQFDQEDLKGSQLNVSADQQSLYLLVEAAHSFVTKLSTVDLQVKFEKNLGPLSNIRFLNDCELIGVMHDFRHDSFAGADLLGSGNSASWSLLRVHCELLDDSRALESNGGVLELLRSDQRIVDFDYFRDEASENVCVLLEDSQVYEIRHEVMHGEEGLLLDSIEWALRYPSNPDFSDSECVLQQPLFKMDPTVEFIESNLQVRGALAVTPGSQNDAYGRYGHFGRPTCEQATVQIFEGPEPGRMSDDLSEAGRLPGILPEQQVRRRVVYV